MCHTNYARKEHALLESFKINFIGPVIPLGLPGKSLPSVK